MGRIAIMKLMGALALLTLWLGNQAGAPIPVNPATAADLAQQIYASGAIATYIGAGVVAIGTLIAIVLYALKNTSRDAITIYSSSREVLYTMAIFVGAAYIYGAFAHPLADPRYPWPFVHGHEWHWQQFGLFWLIVGGFLVTPVVLMTLTLLRELVARLRGSYNGPVGESATLRLLLTKIGQVAESFESIRLMTGEVRTGLAEHRTNDLKSLHSKIDAVVAALRERDTALATDAIGRLKTNLELLRELRENENFDPKELENLAALLAAFEHKPVAPVPAPSTAESPKPVPRAA